MHALIAPDHLDAQCLHAIRQYQMHNSRFSAEASEANHRIMRNILNRLQGFSERAVGNASMQRFFGEVLFNKISYRILMHDSLVRIFHFFHTLVPKMKPYKCGICGSLEHNQRRCKERCNLCGNYYFRGHSKKTCRLLDQPLSPAPGPLVCI